MQKKMGIEDYVNTTQAPITKIGSLLSKFIRSSTVDSIKYVQQLTTY